ncbi:MAG: ATP-binding cassette domain-containing protein [Candidatus Bathyarchaeota archaeon]|nr:MAG: ATP-binding cassette domain-containing protein [Candidatus Bathyarchaeota archaeon]
MIKMETILSTENLCYTYEGQKEYALKNINLKIKEGDFTLIAGPTGSGKSTLALCLSGLIPQVLGGEMKGKVIVDGKDTRQYEVYQMAQYVGLVFQNAENQLCSLNVEDEVTFGPENLGLSKKEIEKRENFVLNATSLSDLRNKYTFNLSGGQKHRTAIAATLSMLPKILLLDEPFSELDPTGCKEVLQTLKKLNEEFGITVVLIEHKLEQVLGFTKNVVLLKDGEIIANGTNYEVFKERQFEGGHTLRIPEALKFSYELVERGLLKKPVLNVEELIASMPQNWTLNFHRISKPFSFNRQERKANSQNALIEVKELCYMYNDGTIALTDINLQVFPGEFIAILGGNGAGKTTLALQMSGQLKPTKGKIYIEGKDVSKGGMADRIGIVGYTFQNPDCQLFCKTVSDEIAFGPKHLNIGKEEVDRRVKATLQMMQLEQFKDRDSHTLSRGQKIGVAVASVLAMRPKLLILDEPTLGQDFSRISSLVDVLKSMNEQGLAVIVITHDVNIAAKYAKRVVIMDKGRVLMDGDPYEVLSKGDILHSASLETPTAVQLSKLIGLPPMLTIEEVSRALWNSNGVEE